MVVGAGQSKVCTVTNTELPANITLFKVVVGGGPLNATQFGLKIDASGVSHNSSVAVTSNAPHAITETGHPDYDFTSMTGTGCPAVLGGTATLNEGEAITCTITNTFDGVADGQ